MLGQIYLYGDAKSEGIRLIDDVLDIKNVGCILDDFDIRLGTKIDLENYGLVKVIGITRHVKTYYINCIFTEE